MLDVRVRVTFLMLVAVTGCDLVYDLERPPEDPMDDAGTPYDRCGPYLYDEPLRYSTIYNPSSGDKPPLAAWSWEAARTGCRVRGMDLAVLNDVHELGFIDEATAAAIWVGASGDDSGWTSVDGCPAVMPAGAGCAVIGHGGKIESASCDGVLPITDEAPAGAVLAAMCETPRPETARCLGNDPAATTYELSSAALTYEAARAHCASRGARIAVFETHAEWLHISRLVTAERWAGFWVGATFDGADWKADTACPASYTWAAGEPTRPPVAGDCTAATIVVSEDPENSGTFLRGLDNLACSNATAMRALCERGN